MFAAAGHDVEITIFREPRELEDAVDRALAADAECIVAGGGDGTISSVAQRILGRDITLGVLPLGTLNHFARDLRIPLDVAAAARIVLDGATRKVDAGTVNGHLFLNNSSLGIYPRIVQLRERYRAKGWTKWIIALWATARVTSASQPMRARIEVEGQVEHRRTPLIFVGNNEYHMEGFDAAGRESIARGHLALYVVSVHGFLPLMRLVWRILTGRARASGELSMVRGVSATVDTARSPVSVAVDGEVKSIETPLRYRILPGAITVCVPATDD